MAAIEYPSTPASIPLHHHQATMEASRSSDAERRQKEENLAKAKANVQRIMQLYRSGKPLFTRTLLKDLHEQIIQGKDEVKIPTWNGEAKTYSLEVPKDLAERCSIQRLTLFDPYLLDLLLDPPTPVSITYVRDPSPPGVTLKVIDNTFKLVRREWQESETCSNLEGSFVKPRFNPEAITITKIVAFGLGTLGKNNLGQLPVRSYAQHAATLTIAAVLKERNISQGLDVQCFSQDPWYNEIDIEFLGGLGITVLKDPEGFLEIDEQTLVFSVGPDVPVRQIVADVQWPAAMVWNSPLSEVQINRGMYWARSPMEADPDSERVGSMLRNYDGAQLDDQADYFGELTVYARRPRS
ncbi:SRR1 family protein [Aspergillus neoniger CBS 115656]|uniref:Cyclic nucleotide-binding domain-containing protein n=1 Tax=Aspergillus neoniger (strain CBS 115656) TaxID=1448310 RepID=A0A318YAM3_ASPNB|nr:hypothetical protein BO87DRAFT_410622 [Aspergillus neoniger CBS 115656]PYH29373.1 hypothetical protein BO87DRAFT_410622 [Aspergillus neoniger CBS 115656]